MLHPPTVLQSFGATLGLNRGIYKVCQRSDPRRLAIAPALGKTCMQINIGGFLTQRASSFAAPPVVRCFPITRIGNFSPKPKGTQNASKRGPKKVPTGKVVGAVTQVRLAQLAAVAWKKKCSDLLLVLAGRQGLAYDVGACTMALRVTLGLVERATLTWDSENGKIKGLGPVFSEASALTLVSVPKLKELFEHYVAHGSILVSDPSIRGRGSPNCDRTALRKLTPEHNAAIKSFVDHRNSTLGAGKVRLASVFYCVNNFYSCPVPISYAGQVTLIEIMNYMRGPLAEGEEDSGDSSSGAEETEAAPVLAEALRVDIPRASLRYLLIHHLQLNYRYTKKKTTFSNPVKRHHRIRKFMIEMDRALKMQDATWTEGGDFQVRGDYVLVFTDETYLHQNHSPLTSWVDETREVGKTSSKGKRLIVLHAVTMDGFVSEIDVDTERPVDEEALSGSKDPRNTAEWIWAAKSKLKDYHDNMTS